MAIFIKIFKNNPNDKEHTTEQNEQGFSGQPSFRAHQENRQKRRKKKKRRVKRGREEAERSNKKQIITRKQK